MQAICHTESAVRDTSIATRGFETVTYMIDGRFAHQDSHGGGGLITDGTTQWMTAGAGILHIETPPAELVESGGTFHGIQLWVNLPRKDKFATPRYQAIEGGEVKLLSSDDGGASPHPCGRCRRRAGAGWDEYADHVGAWDHSASGTPRRAVGQRLQRTRLRAGGRRRRRPGAQPDPFQGQLAVMGFGDRITLLDNATQNARTPALEVLLLGGRPIREPVFHYGRS